MENTLGIKKLQFENKINMLTQEFEEFLFQDYYPINLNEVIKNDIWTRTLSFSRRTKCRL